MHRRLIAPTFHINVLKQFVHLFNRNSKALCDKLAPFHGKSIDAHDYLSETTVEILLGERGGARFEINNFRRSKPVKPVFVLLCLETAMGVDRSTQKRGFDYAMAVMQ